MSVTFPSIKPARRNFRPGNFPTKIYRSLSGATVKRSFGNRAYGYELDLEFTNITDDTANQIVTHYNETFAGFERFTLPPELFAGMSTALRNQIQAPTQLKWEYAAPPEVASVYVGISTVQVKFIGELDY